MSRDRNDRNKNPRRELLVTDVPHPIRSALDNEAAARKESVNTVAVRVLSTHYRVKFQPPENGLRGQQGTATNSFRRNADTTKLTIRGGAKLHRQIAVDAARRGGTLRGVILETLAVHYDLEPEPIGRRPRTKGSA